MEKPRLTVTSILNDIYGKPDVPEEILIHGTNAHNVVEEKYKEICKDIETEKWIELDRGFYILVGKIDIVDHCNKAVIEIKTKRAKRTQRARDQLSAYVAMYRELNKPNWYYGYWLVYDWKNPEKFYLVKPFYLDMTILSKLDEVARKILYGGKNDNRASKNSTMDNK